MEKSQIMKLKELNDSYYELVKEVADHILNQSENYKIAFEEASKLMWNTNDNYFIENLNNEIHQRMELEAPSKRD
ncbi:TPA: hypothetical protein R1962_002323 [Staphylococcus delphini]|nr:hypothetical protein [Staphylococcus delphini]